MPSSLRKRAAASIPAIASKFGMPVSNSPGPTPLDAAILTIGIVARTSGST
jgi:hypothetical protein